MNLTANIGIEIDSDPITLLPVTVAETKTFLSVNHNEHDNMIEDFIRSATADIEQYTRRAIEERSHTVYWRCTDGFLRLPRPPHVSIDAIASVDDTIETAITDYQEFGIERKAVRISQSGQIKIDYTAGYGTTSNDIPQGIKTAIKWQVKLYYSNRNTGQDELIEVDSRSGLVVQAKVVADQFVYYYETG